MPITKTIQTNIDYQGLSRGVSIGISCFVKDVNSISPPAAQSMCFDLGGKRTRYVLNVVLLSWMNRNRLLIPNTRTGTGYSSFFSGMSTVAASFSASQFSLLSRRSSTKKVLG